MFTGIDFPKSIGRDASGLGKRKEEVWPRTSSFRLDKQLRRTPHFIHAFLRGEYLDLTHKLEDPAVKRAARIYFDRCEKMILVAWLNRNINKLFSIFKYQMVVVVREKILYAM